MKVTVLQVPKFKIDFNFSKQQMSEIARDARTIMRDRVGRGNDIHEKRFKHYSKLNEKSGIPTLTVSGRMIGGMVVNARRNYGKISIPDVEQNNKAYYHQEGTAPYMLKPRHGKALKFNTSQGTFYSKGHKMPGLPQREWFGLSARNKTELYRKTVMSMFNKKVK